MCILQLKFHSPFICCSFHVTLQSFSWCIWVLKMAKSHHENILKRTKSRHEHTSHGRIVSKAWQFLNLKMYCLWLRLHYKEVWTTSGVWGEWDVCCNKKCQTEWRWRYRLLICFSFCSFVFVPNTCIHAILVSVYNCTDISRSWSPGWLLNVVSVHTG